MREATGPGRALSASGLTCDSVPDLCELAARQDPLLVELAAASRLIVGMAQMLKHGASSYDRIAEELDAEVESVKRTARRYKSIFTVLDAGRVGLLAGGAR